MSKFQKLADSLLTSNPNLASVFICDDRNAFPTEPQAKAHASARKISYEEYTKEEKKEAAKAPKATKPKK